MKKLNIFYLLAFITGGFLFITVAYVLLRASGLWTKLIPSDNDQWIEHE